MARRDLTIRVDGRQWPILDRIRFPGRSLLVFDRLSTRDRRRFRVWDPQARDQRVLVCLPFREDSFQHLSVLRRLVNGNPSFPQIIEPYRIDAEFQVLISWTRGVTLAEYQRRRPTARNAFDAFSIFRRLAHAACELHHHSLCIHGDLKPDNIVIGQRSNQVVLVDFGSAWTRERTRLRQIGDGFTDGYAAPEQYEEGSLVDHRADQFAVSVVGYELFTGELPYEGLGGKAGLPGFKEACHGTLTPASRGTKDRGRMSSDIWKRIDDVLTTGLSLDPDQRFATRQPWLAAIDDIHARLRLKPELGPVDSFLVNAISWVSSWFRRGKS
jgi:serine/threonine protein kinase